YRREERSFPVGGIARSYAFWGREQEGQSNSLPVPVCGNSPGAVLQGVPSSFTARQFSQMTEESTPWWVIFIPDF
ncbi:MAG: hypothetical protein OEW26_08665, partial [Nitrospirota bacterium]|nr:hypothetical protein [Nitrospirota bacterium]